jgi:redox-sensitive bicupin YhaK (pirin superfamily)
MAAADLDAGSALEVELGQGRGMLIYVTSGALEVNGTAIAAGDQARITAERTLSLRATAAASIIAVEVAGV